MLRCLGGLGQTSLYATRGWLWKQLLTRTVLSMPRKDYTSGYKIQRRAFIFGVLQASVTRYKYLQISAKILQCLMLKLETAVVTDAIAHPLLECSPTLWAGVMPSLRPRTYDGDARVVSHGDAAGSLWLVVSGWVKLTRQTPDGKESITGLCTQGDVFGEAALFANANYPYSAEVVGDAAELVAVPATTMRALVAKEPALSNRVMALLNERTAQAQLKLEHMTTMSAAQRLGCFLLRLCHTQTGGSKTIQIPVEKHILAAYLGMKPETLSRSQQQLKLVGVAVSGQSLTVGDIGTLRQFVCSSCSESGNCEAEDASN